jgi:hypothetical protein
MSTLQQKQAIIAALNSHLASLGKSQVAVSPQQMSPSLLRRDSSALATQNEITFGFQATGGGTPSATSILLGNNDSFIVTDIGLLIKNCADTNAGHAASKYHSFYNPYVFTGANDANLQAIYNGQLQVTIDKVQYLPTLATTVLERIPEVQEGTTITGYVNAAAADAEYTYGRDAKPNALFGFFPVSPFMLKGNNETQLIKVLLSAAVNMAAGADANFASLVFNGFLVSNYNG